MPGAVLDESSARTPRQPADLLEPHGNEAGAARQCTDPRGNGEAARTGTDIGTAGLATEAVIVVIAVCTLIAASTVLVPVVGYLVAAQKLSGAFDALRDWRTEENAVIMTVLLLVIGASMVGKRIGSFCPQRAGRGCRGIPYRNGPARH